MASNHRVTDFEKNSSSDLRRLCQTFSFCLAFTTGWTSLGSLPFIGCFILFSQFILVCFIICKNEKKIVRFSSID